MNQEVYISTDIESNGALPGRNSMLSLGAAAFTSDGELLSTFSVNLEEFPGATSDPDTMKFWDQNKEAYEETRKNVRPIKQAMQSYVS
ncbi:MAG TPA: hypothetical protein VIJ14_03320, partial [Rhabdochlamydiaceae bacterium]